MPFYLRQSVRAGPFRINFSKSGIGVSAGVRGLRVGSGPRGHYVHAGVNGIYYRKQWGAVGKVQQEAGSAPRVQEHLPHQLTEIAQDGVVLTEIESASIDAMQSDDFADLLNDLNVRAQKLPLTPWLIGLPIAGALLLYQFWGLWACFILLIIPFGYQIGTRADAERRVTLMGYDLDAALERSYSDLCDAADGIAACAGLWHVAAEGGVHDIHTWKRNAGASSIVKRSTTTVSYQTPKPIKSNVTPPVLAVGRQRLYLFPDVVLVEERGRFGAVPYSSLSVAAGPQNFIEDGHVPRDAEVVGSTWQFTNKNGTPDRRFNNNRQLPICRYGDVMLQSIDGINERIEMSQVPPAVAFAAAATAFGRIASMKTISGPVPRAKRKTRN